MTTQEFDYQFDVLYNNIMSNAAPGLDSYEKSVFLTKAQDEIIKSYFNPKGNKYQEGFDDSPKRQYDFSKIIKTLELSSIEDNEGLDFLNKNSKLFSLPTDLFLVLNEVIYSGSKLYSVLPISHDEYFRQMTKPYKYPPKNMAWRLINNQKENMTGGPNNTIIEVMGNFGDTAITYTLRYIKTPNPIIIEDIDSETTPEVDRLTIKGEYTKTECELPNELHTEILQRAVELAKIAYIGDVNSSINTGQRSE